MQFDGCPWVKLTFADTRPTSVDTVHNQKYHQYNKTDADNSADDDDGKFPGVSVAGLIR